MDKYRLFKRIKETPDGKELIEFLEFMSKQNYEGFKRSSSDMNDIYKGKALALDGLLDLFKNAEDKINTTVVQKEWL